VRIVLAHGDDPRTSEKIQNLQAAVRVARRTSKILAFADSDGRPSPGWLRALVAPLAEPGVGAATGFRWFTPEPPTFWTLMRSVWDAVAAGRLGPGDSPFAWGGAMAIRKDVFDETGVAERWKNTLSDDYALAAAVHSAGLTIAYAPGALVPSYDRTSVAQFFSWMRRQMMITRRYSPRLWWSALIAHVFYCGGMAASVAASVQGNRLAEWALIAQLSPGMLKGLNRATLAKAALPRCEAWFRRHQWVHAMWVPLATWLWLVALLSSAVGKTFEWRGRKYSI
jgi:cellulose synthase/poly-beta-1,6-N-acetylglucosamine synthase-like glycosyltransferase